jgi:hypothetical protein
MAMVSPHEESMRMRAPVSVHRESGRVPGDVRGCKVPCAAVKTTAMTTAVTATMTAATMATGAGECVGRERQAAERENCGQRKD